MTDRARVAELLRDRRQVLQPEDVGLPRGRRRRTPGLRRDEVAALCSISTVHYARLERRCGPRPSPATLASLARALRFTRATRDELFGAAGYDDGPTHVGPGVMHLLGRLTDVAALAVDPLGEVLAQTPSARTLFGDHTGHTGWARRGYYRWFTELGERQRYPADEHPLIGAEIVADLHRQHSSAAAALVRRLRGLAEFDGLWSEHGDVAPARRCRVVCPNVGVVDLDREVLTADGGLRVVLYLAPPGSDSESRLALASVLGYQRFG